MWIRVILLFLAASALPQANPDDCVSLLVHSQTMRWVALRDLDLYRTTDAKKIGRLAELDLYATPAVTRFEGTAPTDFGSVCVMRDDLERQIAYQLSVILHDWDGVGCVTFEEGRPHSKLFQRREHNLGRELRLYPYGRSGGGWRRIDARAGFTQEVFSFECGVTVGAPGLVKTLKTGFPDAADTVIRADSPLASRPEFRKLSEFEWKGKRYLAGTGLGLPTPAN